MMSSYLGHTYTAAVRLMCRRFVLLCLAGMLWCLPPGTLGGTAAPVSADPAGTLTWSHPQMVNPYGDGLALISCGSATFCVASNGFGYLFTWRGKTWSQPWKGLSGSSGSVYVSCAGATFCVAISPRQYTVWNGHAWSTPVQDPAFDTTSPSVPSQITCPKVRWCVVVLSDANPAVTGYYVWNGAKWSAAVASVFMVAASTGALSCPSPHFCMAGGNGTAYTWNGHGWSGPRALPPDMYGQADPITALSCASGGFCMAITDNADYTWIGGRWSPAIEGPAGFPQASGQPISCPAANFCVGVQATGYAEIWNGLRWTSTGMLLPKFDAFNAISCHSRTFCAAVTQNGEVVFGRVS